MNDIKSPLTGFKNVSKIRDFDKKWLIKKYNEDFSIDVSSLFEDVGDIALYRCDDSDYSFFVPFVMGDSNFYERLSNFPWYYMEWKWEHEITFKLLKKDMNVLEIGCGNGGFLKRLNATLNISNVGLELNENAVKKLVQDGLDIRMESIENHCTENNNKYDVVCSFQVLEHIANIDSFISSSIKCLKPGGRLIISVPNNDSFIGELDHVLNMPPHHVGNWNENSLRYLENIYSIKSEKFYFEPIQSYHLNYFIDTISTKVFGKYFENKTWRKIINFMLVKPFISRYLKFVSKWIPGHTIIGTYIKI
jgi:SAM-dependent methyltransferase